MQEPGPVPEAEVQLKYVMSIRHITQADLNEGRWPRFDDARFVSLNGFRNPPTATTDGDGRFTLDGLPPGLGVFLEITHPRYKQTNAFAATVDELDPVNAAKSKRDVQTGELHVAMPRAGQLHVQVIYEDTGEPASRAQYPDILNNIVYPPTFEVDAAGRFDLNSLDRSNVHLTVYPPAKSDYLVTRERVEFLENVYEKHLTVPLSRGAIWSFPRIVGDFTTTIIGRRPHQGVQ